jgi:hypothetical protein
MLMKSLVFWGITPCNPFESQSTQAAPLDACFTPVSCLTYSSILRMRRHVSPKRRLTSNGLHHVMFQKVGLLFLVVCGVWALPLRNVLSGNSGSLNVLLPVEQVGTLQPHGTGVAKM